ncbi:hypothetical protein [Arthrobacter sp. PM3]|uniref:sunset domain-containing protein n=1 Tax=Arthrobacter sp. PM3 TaxID=2017685 RepID=UPI000E109699|nr:hypothetical protein [Arthrobacter sp. PM3]AXJ11294.1 hypothetical protein CFN17_18040 [Arthrobacter sp. PM3]
MDWIVWLVVIVVVVAVIWAILNRNKSRQGADSASASAAAPVVTPAPTPTPTPAPAPEAAAPVAPPPAAEPESAASEPGAAQAAPAEPRVAGAAPALTPEGAGAPDGSEWETQWSETAPPAGTHAAVHHEPGHGAHAGAGTEAAAAAVPVHHPEYTGPHAPTLPGAESAAAERLDDAARPTAVTPEAPAPAPESAAEFVPESAPLADAETLQTAASSAAAESSASHTAEPAGHLATDQPYGEGSAAPAADGSGPEGFTVKGNASSMIYHDETSPAYDETRAEVWFVSAAHAEAAGFRPPRRTRQ